MEKQWGQRRVFVERINEFCRNNGLLTPRGAVKMDIAADLFNLHEDTLRQFMQNSSRKRPGINTLTHIASVLGCSVTEFLDSPNDPPPSIPRERWGCLTEKERGLVTSMISEIASLDLSEADKEFLHNNFLALKKSLIQLKKRG